MTKKLIRPDWYQDEFYNKNKMPESIMPFKARQFYTRLSKIPKIQPMVA